MPRVQAYVNDPFKNYSNDKIWIIKIECFDGFLLDDQHAVVSSWSPNKSFLLTYLFIYLLRTLSECIRFLSAFHLRSEELEFFARLNTFFC